MENNVTPSNVPAARLINPQSLWWEIPTTALTIPPATASKNASTT
jgi:hypothetical protein